MGLLNVERFVKVATAEIPNRTLQEHITVFTRPGDWYSTSYADGTSYFTPRRFPVDREAALAVYNEIKTFVVDKGSYWNKNLRPWNVDPTILDDLDQTVPWWGFEFETGYATAEDRSDVVRHVWDTWDNVCFDEEGEFYPCEITFAPEEEHKYTSGEAQALGFVEYLSSIPDKVACDKGSTYVGTHFNLSLPAMRGGNAASRLAVERVASILNNTLHQAAVDGADFKQLFGRTRLYGGFFNQNSWVEGKLFRTTYDFDTFQEYLRVASVLTRIAEAVVEDGNSLSFNSYPINSRTLLEGTDTQPVWGKSYEHTGSDYGDYVSGDYGNDADDDDDFGW